MMRLLIFSFIIIAANEIFGIARCLRRYRHGQGVDNTLSTTPSTPFRYHAENSRVAIIATA